MSYLEFYCISGLMAAALIAVVFRLLSKYRDTPGAIMLLLFYSAFFICIEAYLYFSAEPVPEKALDWFAGMLAAKSFVPAFLLFFALLFTNPFFHIKPRFWLAVLAAPCATAVLLLFFADHGFLFKTIEILRFYPNKSLAAEWGAWSYVNAAYGYGCLLASFILFVAHYRKSSSIYKWQSSIFMLGVALFTLLDLVSLLIGEGVSILGLIMMGALLFVGYFLFTASDLAFIANGAAFEKISSIALVAENDGKILMMNEAARKAFAHLPGGLRYDELIQAWMNGGSRSDQGGAAIIKTNKRFYEVFTNDVLDKKKKKLGMFVEMRDITTQQNLITELNHLVNYDQLTGLYNRHYFDLQCKKLDTPEALPLAFISGDLNKLKQTNDVYGHAVGDRLITLAGEILSQCAPAGASVFRVGGDEYLVIIPNCDKAAAEKYIEQIKRSAAEVREDPFGNVDISIGYAIRDALDVSIQQTLNSADLLMYQEKQNAREAARPYH